MLRAALEPVLEAVSGRVVYPLADWKNRSARGREAATLRRSQWWSRERLEGQQRSRLREIVAHARTAVPYYREMLRSVGEVAEVTDLAQLPLLRKQHLRDSRLALLADGLTPQQLLSAKTGGSTGTSLLIYFDDACRQYKNAAAMRADEWAGWKPGATVAALWGNPPVYGGWRGKLFAALHERMIFLDTMSLNDEVVRAFNDRMIRTRIRYLFGHAHSLYRYCESLKRQQLPVPHIAGIVATSMMLLEPERTLIEHVLRCPVTNRYGCEEVGLIACECGEHSGLHVTEEHAIVEIVDESGKPVPEGEPGLVCVTDLINRSMPLLRYVVEDVAVMSSQPCACGRVHRRLEKIVGRTADFLKRSDGTLVAGVSLVELTLTAIEGLSRLQLVQESVDALVANVVPGQSYTSATAGALTRALRAALGERVAIDIRVVSELTAEKNGKYRFAICKC